jgi:hypothetical protein
MPLLDWDDFAAGFDRKEPHEGALT